MKDQREAQLKKFKRLDEEWRADVISRKNPEELNKMIRDAAVNMVELRIAKQLDEDLARIKEELATANEVYKEGEAENALRIEFLVDALRCMGVNVPSFSKKAILKAGLPAKKSVDEELSDALVDSKKSALRVSELLGQFIEGVEQNLDEGSSVEISTPRTGKTIKLKGKGKKAPPAPVPVDDIDDPDLKMDLDDDTDIAF